MATTSEEKELLIEFYNRNEELFKRALEVMCDNADSEEEANNYKTMVNSINSIKKSKVRRFFKIEGIGEGYKMYEVVAEFVKYLRKKGKTFDEIENIIKGYTKEKICHISTTKENVRRQEKCYEANYEDVVFYVTKEWGLGSKGRNFDGLLKGIEKDYPKFLIQEA